MDKIETLPEVLYLLMKENYSLHAWSWCGWKKYNHRKECICIREFGHKGNHWCVTLKEAREMLDAYAK